MNRQLLPLLAGTMIASASAAGDPAEVSQGEKLFALKVKPLFAEKCMACHGDEPEKLKGGFDMRTRSSMLQGGDTFGEEVVRPGQGAKSFLYLTTTRSEEDFEMPPKEADKLTEAQTLSLKYWIDEGAPWPNEERVAYIQDRFAEGEQVLTSKALSDDWQTRRYEVEKLWAYRPLNVPAVPEGAHPVDYFIDARLTEADLVPAPAAEARELARRVNFGLTGLPPRPIDVRQFAEAYEQDPSEAVRAYVERLMESPHYGEHFGRHWLDVARYADTAGFANDYTRPNAWRYRDYVIRAFNQDKPYDQFVLEQIAGDEVASNDSEHLIATGFLRMGPWEQTSMSVFKETRQMWLDDVTDSVGQSFLAHAMQCAKCHDHKFDPVPTRDYYRLMAVFSTTQFAEREARFIDGENLSGFKESNEWVKAKVAGYEKQHQELLAKIKDRKTEETGSAKTGDNNLDPGDEASLGRMTKNMTRHRFEYDRTQPLAHAVYTGHTIERKNVQGRLEMPKNRWGKGAMEKDAILTGGNVYSPSDPVNPGALSAAESLGNMEVSPFPEGQGKRRLALAEWIVDEKNPLTARVMVNRVWSWHFGKGLAGNPNNFGGTGGLPSHPELLDYLADWFMKHDWSVKRLNGLITSSKTYRRSSRHPNPDDLADRDPKALLYASFPPRRLTAEELRDAMLAVSAELNRTVGGIPVRPDVNMEVAMQPRQIMGGTASVYEPDPLPKQRNRRTIYAEKIRGLRDPFLSTFNQPGPDKSCELRETSTVAPQALTLFNAQEVQDRALAFAASLVQEDQGESATIRRAFMKALSRPPYPAEMDLCLTHWKQTTAEESGKNYEARNYPDQTKRTVMAEKTGEPYDFIEHMPAYTSYQPDLQPHEVDARTRGLAQICLALVNSNEFVYLD